MTKAEAETTQPTARTDAFTLATRVAFGLSAAVALVTLAAVFRLYAPSLRAEPQPASAFAPPDAGETRWAAAEPIEEQGEPVLFVNPFDETEVFEFPAGTTEAAARAAVAEILMARATERYARLQAASYSRR